jgi:transcriptional regulator with XRE-family HTH domain
METTVKRTKIKDLLKSEPGMEVLAKGWVRTKRGNKQVSYYNRFTDAVRIHAIQRHLRMQEIADRTGYSRQSFSAVMNRKTYITARLVHTLIRIFKLSETEQRGLAEAAAETNRELRKARKKDIYFTPEEILNDNSGDS